MSEPNPSFISDTITAFRLILMLYVRHMYLPQAPRLPSRTFACTISSELLGLYFIFSLFFRFWAVR